MRAYDIIHAKRDGQTLSEEQIAFIIKGITGNTVPDYQAAAFLMAAFLQGLNDEETAHLTTAMMHSGDVLDLSGINPATVDKHSTGGVGDKISLIIAPAAAACGAVVPMMSGRGLGHTGGTLDKLESIPGFRVGLDELEFRQALSSVGFAMIGQTGSLAPADKKLYALRDVTATVESIPLITASIMSKKCAAGPASIVMDVKWGSGAFMKDLEQARALATSLAAVGHLLGRKVTACISDMNQPLGVMVGNALEVKEALACLRGEGPPDVQELSRVLTGEMLRLAGKAETREAGEELYRKAVNNGSALAKFREMVVFQGGDPALVDDPQRLPTADQVLPLAAPRSGYLHAMDCTEIGIAAILLGAGRERAEDDINHAVGIEVLKKPGDQVQEGEPLARFHCCQVSRSEEARQRYLQAVDIASQPPPGRPLIAEVIT